MTEERERWLQPRRDGGPVGVEDVVEFKTVIAVQDPDVVVAGVDDLDLVRVRERPAEKRQVNARLEGIDQVDALFRADLQQTELLPEIPERVVLRVDGDDG